MGALSILASSYAQKTEQAQDPRMAGFQGKIGKTFQESIEDWPVEPTFTGNETNVVIFLLDDVGYGQLGCFGGLVPTPNIDKLAANGLRFTNFHTTALSSPSRACLLTGRNHHSVGLGSHALTAMGFPGYAGRVPYSAQEVARLARDEGYTTYALGKWDHTPCFQVHQLGPFKYWPTQDGFDHTYTFMSADINNFTPVMYAGHEPIEPSMNDPDYHLSKDLADKAIYYLTGQVSLDPDKPFFMFWASGAMHAPHHAPPEYIERFKGKFDMGWDKAREMIYQRQLEMGVIPRGTKLTERRPEIPAWESLSEKEKKMYARQMEAFAGQLSHVDEQIGRVVQTLERLGKLDNTLIIVASDNGASAEGGLAGSHNEVIFLNGIAQTNFEENYKRYDQWGSEATDNHYHAGWAWAGNTPFKYFKQIVHRGGQTDPLVIHWPKGIQEKGGIRMQYAHIIDIVPTILEATGIKFQEQIDGIEQIPLEGTSMVYAFNDKTAPERHVRQYYELYGNRAMYLDGWKVVTVHGDRMPWIGNKVSPFENDVWELYNVAEDFSESNNLADKYPEKVKELISEWDIEAVKYNVYPLYDDIIMRGAKANEHYAPIREKYIYFPPGAIRIPDAFSPPIKNRNHTITAYATVDNNSSGVLIAHGGIYSGYTFFVKNNKLYYEYNAFNEEHYQVVSNSTLPAGPVELKAVYTANRPLMTGVVELFVNGKKVGEGKIDRIIPSGISLSETMDIGMDTGSPVSKEYDRNNQFSGNLEKVVIDLPKQ